MAEADLKTDLHRYLREARAALLWKLDGLPERDIRRPLTPTGTNLLGLVKHLITVELLYLSHVFGEPFDEPVAWFRPDAEPNADLWATADESREYIVGLYRRACEHSDGTIAALPLDSAGYVEWFAEPDRETTLHGILLHMIAETNRHAGHADVVRELIDGAVGLHEDIPMMAPGDQEWWADYRNRLERIAAGTAQS
ncbi:DinB family protein [Saccharopolyspora sp. NPDC050642]|uniref:DinB family protein n=1 Tax=Saccharopolyspora sp. NPDC050642 TaxID=3157099 RepID=UPI0033FD8436